jgi:hypothetical protein
MATSRPRPRLPPQLNLLRRSTHADHDVRHHLHAQVSVSIKYSYGDHLGLRVDLLYMFFLAPSPLPLDMLGGLV